MELGTLELLAPWLDPRTAYIHVPFCAHHCGYCDFAVTAGQDHLIDLYLDALAAELATLGAPRPVESLFIGGGTPTHLSANQLERLLEAITRWLPSALEGTSREFSIEANPDSLTEEKAAVLAAVGVNRVSIGVQSFRPESLAVLDRRHAPEHIGRAVEVTRKHIATVSFDLIFGAPGSTLASWCADLDAALAFAPQHVSTYGLTYEKGTPLWKRQHRGQVAPVPEDDELAMYERAMDRLAEAGFEHYEISNFARPGFRCRHNERYWANEAYYGFGVGAARYVHGARELNVRDTKLYIRKALSGEPVAFQREELEPRARAFETMATQLRRADGINRTRFHEQTGFALDTLAPAALALLRENALVSDNGSDVRLTRRGKCVADAAVSELLKEA
ncbi:Oxygen-independent coproporphyrinogen-III oxidase 1 [Gemmata sp. SH-PL17]|uniref:radical SAM family heme chaperone HemW n=1 Tax=Gemmata sp. SH-PL17 TaxID=1630693 RepID=UPI00078C97FE|nr:radical SAM family heme chaperone HemW [Gemmata sp. SH-PL17]AMV23618.1 Oxygen-independent coproporphyrinogen-III oxidase 1 [Gemmata sp. SH-PL17]